MKSNYVFKPTAELSLRLIQPCPPRRLNTALVFIWWSCGQEFFGFVVGFFSRRLFVISRIGRAAAAFLDCGLAPPPRAVGGRVSFSASPAARTSLSGGQIAALARSNGFSGLVGLRRCSAQARAGFGFGKPGSTHFAGWRQDCRIGAQRRLFRCVVLHRRSAQWRAVVPLVHT